MELALGTVQFGLPYGIAGRREQVPEAEVRNILACAFERGVRMLDTASAYGDIEPRLTSLMGATRFQVVSKIRPRPSDLSSTALAAWAKTEVQRGVQRLGSCLRGLMFHRQEDLLEAQAAELWHACAEAAQPHGIALGVSCYGPEALQALCVRLPVAIAQMPMNALDQRFQQLGAPATESVRIHLRSAFLQGLLLMRPPEAQARLPAAAQALERWQAWCARQGLSQLQAALGIVKGASRASHCVVGTDDLQQFEAIADAWDRAPALQAPELHESDPQITDPRQWALVAA